MQRSELLTAAQMRAAEQAEIEAGRVSGATLMARAGHGVVQAMLDHWPALRGGSARAHVLCGPGNNGGDGFVVADLLAKRGWDVQVYALQTDHVWTGDAAHYASRWTSFGGGQPVLPIAQLDPAQVKSADVIVDALFGTGLSRPLGAELTAQLQALGQSSARRVAVDIPSGVCADSGRVLGACVMGADLTVTFHRRKLGHCLDDCAVLSGAVVCADIGLADDGLPDDCACYVQVSPSAAQKAARGHKFGHGSAFVVSGGAGRSGAARLTGYAALRMGAGLVTLGVPADAQAEVAAQITALMMTAVDGPRDLEKVLQDVRIGAVCLGPGLGQGQLGQGQLGQGRTRALVPIALQAPTQTYVVLDADALSAYADAPERLFGSVSDRVVLTPHMGEFARLFPDLAVKLRATPQTGPAYSKTDAARAAAARAGCTVVLKGASTVIADARGRCAVHSAHGALAAPWLATAGSGDVLAGFVTGLLARGFAPFEAAQSAVWLHAACARRFGPGLIAEDLADALPDVLRELVRDSV